MDKILETTTINLLKRRPFYGHLLLACRREKTSGNHPLGITLRAGLPVLSVNFSLFSEETAAAREALLEHVLKHLLHLHMVRRKGRNRHDWDLCCDLAINPTIGDLPAAARYPVEFGLADGLSAEEYFSLLTPAFDFGNLSGGGAGDEGADTGGSTGRGEELIRRGTEVTVDDHGVWDEADSTPSALAEEVVRTMVRQAWEATEGEVPADVAPLVASLLGPGTIPWQRLLQQFIATAGRIGRRNTWMREHRRFGHRTPGVRKCHRLNLLVGVDVSDSTNAAELREAFAEELVRIARGREAVLTVVYAGSRIHRIDRFHGNNLLPEVYLGGGFTDLRPVFAHARSMTPPPAAVVYLTDGYGPAPERMEFPTLWVLTGGGRKPAPWGVELRLPENRASLKESPRGGLSL